MRNHKTLNSPSPESTEALTEIETVNDPYDSSAVASGPESTEALTEIETKVEGTQ